MVQEGEIIVIDEDVKETKIILNFDEFIKMYRLYQILRWEKLIKW